MTAREKVEFELGSFKALMMFNQSINLFILYFVYNYSLLHSTSLCMFLFCTLFTSGHSTSIFSRYIYPLQALAALRVLQHHQVRVKMASHSQLFSISYRTLLASIAEELDWSEPIYNQVNTGQNGVYVLLSRTNSPLAYFFSGTSQATKAESEEDVAEQAVDYLVQRGRVIVDDVNLEKRRMYKACARFYKDKSTALQLIRRVPARICLSGVIDMNNHPLGNKPKIVSIDYWKLLLQIVAAFKIHTTEVEDLFYDNDTRVCTLRINWENSYNKVCYFIGDCSSTLEKARQSLAKKIVCYLEIVFGFGVKDANYYGMIYAEMRAGVQRERYLAATDRLEKEMCVLAANSEEVCVTPDGPAHQIKSGLALPPPPKKLKTLWRDAASSSTTREPMYKTANAGAVIRGVGASDAGVVEEGV